MKTGISTASLFMRQATEDAMSTINSIGASCMEVFLSTFYEYRPEFSKKYAENAGRCEVNSIHAQSLNFEHQLFSANRRIRGDGYYWLDQLMRSAQLLKCVRYTFHGQYRLNSQPPDDYGFLAERLREACDFCARYGVQLCLENVEWSTCNRPEVFKEIKNRVPQIAAAFDIKQARRSGYPYQMYIENMSGSLSHVHLSDIDENGKICLPGKGIYDWTEIFKRLKGAGFDGACLLEVYPKNYNDISELKNSLGYLDEIIYKLN